MANFDPYVEQIAGLKEQQALAQQLRNQGLEAPQGQMASGRYVAPAASQYLAQALKSYLGGQDVASAQQGIKDLMTQRQKETADYLAQMPKPVTSDMEIRTPETMNQMGPQPTHQMVTKQPSTQDYMAWATRAPGMDAGTAAQLGLKSAEMEAARQARLAEKQLAIEAEAKRDRQRQEDRQDNLRLAAGLKPAPQEKPLTEFQGKSVTFGTRAAQSHNILDEIGANYDPLAVAASHKGGALVNWALSPENQKVAQAQTNFLTAVLRQESGATIQPSEFDTARKQYFPQPGDSDEVIAQKRDNRDLIIKGFARQAGPSGAVDIAEVYNAKRPAPANSPANPSPAATNMPDQTAIAAEIARRQRAATGGR